MIELADRALDSKRAPTCLKRWIRILIAIACVWASGFWYFIVRPAQNHRRAYERIEAAVDSLSHRRPENVSRNQWSFVIGWTSNGIGNCCAVHHYLNQDQASYDRFAELPDRFEERLRGDVGLDDVDWLWDELEAISKYGKWYSARWRPTTLERLAEGDALEAGSIGPTVH